MPGGEAQLMMEKITNMGFIWGMAWGRIPSTERKLGKRMGEKMKESGGEKERI